MIESLLPFSDATARELAPLIEMAFDHETTESVEILLREAGACVVSSHLNEHGQSPLLMMAQMLNEVVLKALIPVSDLSARDPKGRTALMLAAQGESSYDPKGQCIEALLPVSDVFAVDHQGATALAWALREGNAMAAEQIGAFAALLEKKEIEFHALAPKHPARKPSSL